MTTDKTFRVQVRFNKVEFADLESDLKQYEGRDLAGRVRLLMRLGLDAARGRLHPASSHVHLASVSDLHPSPEASSSNDAVAERAPTLVSVADEAARRSQPVAPVVEAADRLDFIDELDPSSFLFSFKSA